MSTAAANEASSSLTSVIDFLNDSITKVNSSLPPDLSLLGDLPFSELATFSSVNSHNAASIRTGVAANLAQDLFSVTRGLNIIFSNKSAIFGDIHLDFEEELEYRKYQEVTTKVVISGKSDKGL